jgi:XTP/dITP diphosphohydrolase
MAETTELLVATHNEGKIRELTQMLAGLPLRVRRLAEWPDIEEAEETGSTFGENAVLKALYYSSRTGLLTLSDDSGLEVAALGGAPGVRSARYCGASATYAERIARLLAEVEAAGGDERAARFVSVIALADPSTGEVETFEGVVAGRLADAPRGAGGFGYDPVFIPEGHEQTFGELPDSVKQNISHRARAFRLALASLNGRFP